MNDGLHAPESLQDKEAIALMKRSDQHILKVAEADKIIVNIEPHFRQCPGYVRYCTPTR